MFVLSEKKKGFASALKKRFSRSKKPRSHSADRAGSLREENLLHPPDSSATKTTGTYAAFYTTYYIQFSLCGQGRGDYCKRGK